MNDSTSDRHVPADTSVDPSGDVPRTAGQQFEQISSDELECYRDAEWAMHDPEVQRKYDGQWVVAFRRAIVAHGTDCGAVLDQANQAAGKVAHRLVFCLDDGNEEWLQHSPDTSIDFPNA